MVIFTPLTAVLAFVPTAYPPPADIVELFIVSSAAVCSTRIPVLAELFVKCSDEIKAAKEDPETYYPKYSYLQKQIYETK